MHPRFEGGKIWHIIVVDLFAKLMALLLEYWAPAIPAGMACHPAGYTLGVAAICASLGLVLKCTGAADVCGYPAFGCHVGPAMAFQAVEWLLLAFFCVTFL